MQMSQFVDKVRSWMAYHTTAVFNAVQYVLLPIFWEPLFNILYYRSFWYVFWHPQHSTADIRRLFGMYSKNMCNWWVFTKGMETGWLLLVTQISHNIFEALQDLRLLTMIGWSKIFSILSGAFIFSMQRYRMRGSPKNKADEQYLAPVDLVNISIHRSVSIIPADARSCPSRCSDHDHVPRCLQVGVGRPRWSILTSCVWEHIPGTRCCGREWMWSWESWWTVCMSCLLTKYARVKVDGTALMQRFIQAMYVVPYLWAVPCGKCRFCLEYPGWLPWEGLVIIDAEEAYILYSLKLLVVSGLVQQGPCVIYKTIWTCWTLKKSMLVVKLVKA